MKFMGSKRAMLANGLGEVLAAEVPKSRRFADLFTGSGSVAWHCARQWDVEVVACDLQRFAVALAESVIARTHTLKSPRAFGEWIERAREAVATHASFRQAVELQKSLRERSLRRMVKASRDLCASSDAGPVEGAYGGYYFSPLQAFWFDAMRATLPTSRSERLVALAALIQAASRCAASPGHTAQPFKPNATAGPYLKEAWSRDPVVATRTSFETLATFSARRRGRAVVGDAADVARTLDEGDLVFVDPPYSGVHYSRFYHVLETVAGGAAMDVSGAGRYPPPQARPRSAFSIGSKSAEALRSLLASLASSGVRAIITFPAGVASNGLSGSKVVDIAAEYFRIERKSVTGRFSTLGGNRVNRSARQVSSELILTLSPR